MIAISLCIQLRFPLHIIEIICGTIQQTMQHFPAYVDLQIRGYAGFFRLHRFAIQKHTVPLRKTLPIHSAMNPTEKEIRALYSLCFADSPAFTEAYFDCLYTTRNSPYIKRDGKIVSALQITECGINVKNGSNGDIRSCYLSGIATHPDYRRKGLAATLIARTLRKRYACEDGFATLIPATPQLAEYYGTMGFTPCFDYIEETYRPSAEELRAPDLLAQAEEEDPEAFAPYYEYLYADLPTGPLRYLRNGPTHLDTSLYYTDMRTLMRGYMFTLERFHKLRVCDMQLYGGTVWKVATPKREILAEAVAYPLEDALYVPTLTADSEACRLHMLRLLAAHYRLPRIRTIRPPRLFTATEGTPIGIEGCLQDPSNGECPPTSEAHPGTFTYSPVRPLGMARIVAVDVLIESIAAFYPDLRTSFSLADPLLPENDGTYILHGDGTALLDVPGRAPEVSVAQLTQALIGYHTHQLPEPLRCFPNGIPYMHFMMHK